MELRPVTNFIKQKYLINERDIQQDAFSNSINIYFKRTKKRIYGFTLISIIQFVIEGLFFLLLLIPSIVLQQDSQEVVVFPQKGGQFTVKEQLDPPISLEIVSSDSYLLSDVQLYLDGQTIEQFTIEKKLNTNSTHKITSNKSFKISINLMMVAVRLISQFSFVPRSYLIIQTIMVVLSLLYLIQEILRMPKI
ncbi:unnamed protein product (macronuclear) [Paramecium tetraurelia]|uniref:Transmembrane protein n=1 Tax=Paramecium tetraurelia TaxID=5888 RepID=A0BG01_PARTE|nr:uncharacterized protein GSPATT00028503001 [Paramecium tetraurelia]CAK57468.1 unnamed protein product [Paramecium tetraurelia]|eukprot:XP_001424866.1 hypothetical protein (macronuclear) [Paramecium tetraurelia strain d4-2]